MTQQNAALVEQAAAAAQSLQEQADHLAQVVSVFELDEMPAMPAQEQAIESSERDLAPVHLIAAVA